MAGSERSVSYTHLDVYKRQRFDSNKLPNEYFTGTIPGGGIQNALNILMLTSPFYYEMDGSVIVLKEK